MTTPDFTKEAEDLVIDIISCRSLWDNNEFDFVNANGMALKVITAAYNRGIDMGLKANRIDKVIRNLAKSEGT